MKRRTIRLAQVALSFLLCSLPFSLPSEAQSALKPLALSRMKDITDDLDGLLKRRAIRTLVPYSKTIFFIDRGRHFGTAAEAGLAF